MYTWLANLNTQHILFAITVHGNLIVWLIALGKSAARLSEPRLQDLTIEFVGLGIAAILEHIWYINRSGVAIYGVSGKVGQDKKDSSEPKESEE